MDTSKLVVGQKVWMQSGDEPKEGEVSKITEKYVEVEIVEICKANETTVAEVTRRNAELAAALFFKSGNPPSTMMKHKYYVRFDKNGEQPDFYDPNVRDMNAHIRDWNFGIYGYVDGWSPLRLCGKNGEPYVLLTNWVSEPPREG